jgi:polyisoprenoid-binding protein YceI
MAIIASGVSSQDANAVDENSLIGFEAVGMKMIKVKGTFSGFDGEVRFMPSDLENSVFNVCIDATTVNTGSKGRDKHLKSEDFFKVADYPSICFESKSIEKLDEGFLTKGSLSMVGNTYDFEIPFTFEDGLLRSSFTINRLDYKLGEDVGTFKASEEIFVSIVYRLNN